MTISRRTLVQGSAWATPAIIATASVPAYAASPQCPTVEVLNKSIYEDLFSAAVSITGIENHPSLIFTVTDGVFTDPLYGNFTASADGKVLTFTNSEQLDNLMEVFTVQTEAQEVVITYQAGPACTGYFTIKPPSETCPTETDITFTSEHVTAKSSIPILSLDESNRILLEVTSMPADARIVAQMVSFDTAAVDTSLWKIISPTELAYIGEPDASLSTHLPLTSTGLEVANVFVDPTKFTVKSKAWGDACRTYGVPVDGYDCVNGFEAEETGDYFDIVIVQAPSPSLTFVSADCQVEQSTYFYVDHTQKPSHIDFSLENVSVTADSISFDFTGSLYGLLVYTSAKDGTPVNNGPAQLTNIMGSQGYYGYSTSTEYVSNLRINIPLSGERVPGVIIGKVKYDSVTDYIFPHYKTGDHSLIGVGR